MRYGRGARTSSHLSVRRLAREVFDCGDLVYFRGRGKP